MSQTTLIAQCVMCYRTAAAQQGGRAEVLNTGILILLAAPLAVLAALGILIWKRETARRRAQCELSQSQPSRL